MTTVFRALQSLPAVGGDHGLRLRITLARCFREIGVLQPLVCTASRDKGAKAGLLRGDGLGEAVCDSQNAW